MLQLKGHPCIPGDNVWVCEMQIPHSKKYPAAASHNQTFTKESCLYRGQIITGLQIAPMRFRFNDTRLCYP